MNQEQAKNLLDQGIKAARKGDREGAQSLLLSFLEVNPDNEKAWLWLSSVIDDDGDKLICLENALVINPKSQPALRGLEKLHHYQLYDSVGAQNAPSAGTVRKPISLASAVLYPQRQIHNPQPEDSIKFQYQQTVGYSARSAYNNIWEQDIDICQYCAATVTLEDKKCPNCDKSLFVSGYRYPKPSADLTIFWVLLLGIAQFSLILVMSSLLLRGSLVEVIWQGVIFIVLIALAVAVFLRQFWAYMVSIVFLFLSTVTLSVNYFAGSSGEDVVLQAVANGFFHSLSDRAFIFILQPIENLIIPLQIIVVFLTFLFAIFKLGPDFERVIDRRVAQLDRDLSDATQYYAAGCRYADEGKFANAVLHFRKAAALAPSQPYYLRSLGTTYATLGYYQRSLDVLESAHNMALDDKLRRELEHLLHQLRIENAGADNTDIG